MLNWSSGSSSCPFSKIADMSSSKKSAGLTENHHRDQQNNQEVIPYKQSCYPSFCILNSYKFGFLKILFLSLKLTIDWPPELQQRSSKVLEKCSLWSLFKVGNLYQASTTLAWNLYQSSPILGLDPVSSGPPKTN